MSNLVINDLPESNDLDHAALMAIVGGISFGWIVPYTNAIASSRANPGRLVSITNNFIDNDYFLIQQNPTNINVYNAADNAGSIINSINVTPVSAASPFTAVIES